MGDPKKEQREEGGDRGGRGRGGEGEGRRYGGIGALILCNKIRAPIPIINGGGLWTLLILRQLDKESPPTISPLRDPLPQIRGIPRRGPDRV